MVHCNNLPGRPNYKTTLSFLITSFLEVLNEFMCMHWQGNMGHS